MACGKSVVKVGFTCAPYLDVEQFAYFLLDLVAVTMEYTEKVPDKFVSILRWLLDIILTYVFARPVLAVTTSGVDESV